MDEPALGLPSREYYLHNYDSPPLRAYFKYMIDMAILMGANTATVKEEMKQVLDFETMLANVRSSAEVIQLFSRLTQVSMKFKLHMNCKIVRIKGIFIL